jgi:hypothetical protein
MPEYGNHPCVASIYTNAIDDLFTANTKSTAAPLMFDPFRPTVTLFVAHVPA